MDGDLERQMAFIVEQQTQFASGIQQLREQTEIAITRLANETREGSKRFDVKLETLMDHQIALALSQARTEKAQRLTEARIRLTTKNVARTEEAVRNFIAAVERNLTRRNNGSS